MTAAAGDLIAITGGTGAIGQRVIADLLDAGFRVRSLSRSAPSSAAEHVQFDLTSNVPVPVPALEGCKAVVHLAAYIPANQEDPTAAELCLRTNALGTLKLLQAAEEAGVDQLLQTTSANAYAPGLDGPAEDEPMYPAARAPFYLSSKLVQDVLGAYWNGRRGLGVTNLRLSSVYGAALEQALFTRFARALRAGEPIRLANGGSFGADFVELSDVSTAVMLFLRSGVTGPFNIASGQRTTLLEAAQALLELTGNGDDKLVVEPVEHPEAGFPRMDISKARQCGFVPTDIEAGLAKLVQGVDREAG